MSQLDDKTTQEAQKLICYIFWSHCQQEIDSEDDIAIQRKPPPSPLLGGIWIINNNTTERKKMYLELVQSSTRNNSRVKPTQALTEINARGFSTHNFLDGIAMNSSPVNAPVDLVMKLIWSIEWEWSGLVDMTDAGCPFVPINITTAACSKAFFFYRWARVLLCWFFECSFDIPRMTREEANVDEWEQATRSSVFHLSTSLSLDIYFFSTLSLSLWAWAPCVLFVIFNNLYQWRGLSLLLFLLHNRSASTVVSFNADDIFSFMNRKTLELSKLTWLRLSNPHFARPPTLSSSIFSILISWHTSRTINISPTFSCKKRKLKLSALCGWNSKEYRKKFQHITRFTLDSQHKLKVFAKDSFE